MKLETCRSCHHTEQAGVSGCLSCHNSADVRGVKVKLTRTLDIRVGSLDRPERVLPFDHSLHMGECQSCHNQGLALSAAATNCAGCHGTHQNATANCASCHAAPAAAVHKVSAHLGCGGAGCHENAPREVLEMPRTRALCLACHTDRVDHQPTSTCSTCHVMPVRKATARP